MNIRYPFLITIACLFAHSAAGGEVSDADIKRLRADITMITNAVTRGDPGPAIDLTHPSLFKVAGGREAFADLTRKSVQEFRDNGLEFLSVEIGAPTRLYSAGNEEVCFVPRISVMAIQGKKAKSTSFMIAIRHVGGTDWKYLDGSGLRKNPDVLYQLLPALERGIQFPPNAVEPL